MYIMPNGLVLTWQGTTPKLGAGTFVAAGAALIGDVETGKDSSFWFNAVVRGDVNFIRIGDRTNLQDNAVVHVTRRTAPTRIGNDVTIGHAAVIHGCTIEDGCLIGMNATVLDGAVIGRNSMVAAGALVTPGKKFPPGKLILGSPAVVARDLTPEELEHLRTAALNYVQDARSFFPK